MTSDQFRTEHGKINRNNTQSWTQNSMFSSSMEPLQILPDKFLWGRLHTGTTHEKQKKLARSFNFMLCYNDVLSLINFVFVISLIESIPLSLN